MEHTKTDWRRTLMAARAAIPEEERRAASAAITDRVRTLAYFSEARTILGYVAVGAEANCGALLVEGNTRSIPVYVPVPNCAPDRPRWLPWGESCVPAAGDASVQDLTYPVLVLVPGVGFDHSGMRLGRGGGFYDRALADLRRAGAICAVGLAFERQIVPMLPCERWDQRVDVVASERRVVNGDVHVRRPAAAGMS